ncbi:hypothetical protein O4H49_04445 [Kiloniella laminariae]|uniref:Uncharacterized protein n=1 Tax=Kiloniella laminariae TaxID=454162 RepID=A0ABT4LFZ3_9PROT|nr:hypothetical protein [Kiloniella laminariae]MCZ4280014.1 hypothetical protein [Kiloniella laminariae]
MPNIPDSRAPARMSFSLPDENIDAVTKGGALLSDYLANEEVQMKIRKLFLGEPEEVIDSDKKQQSNLVLAQEEKRQARQWQRQEQAKLAGPSHHAKMPLLLNGRVANSMMQSSRRDK